jgi:cephalosporin-C deacetylase
MFTDLDESELQSYRSEQADPDDFDAFWQSTLEQSRAVDLNLVATRLVTPLTQIDVYDVTFAGFGGQPIKAWLRVPAGTSTALPTVVQFVSYGGGRGLPIDNLLWSSAGFAHFQMDTRGQGSEWSVGDTPDPEGAGPQASGFMTRGIGHRDSYYYRRVFVDAVRAVEAACALDLVDARRLAVMGHSQGGGIALAVAGLLPGLGAVIADAPLLCDFPRATIITDHRLYGEIRQYLSVHRYEAESVHRTLSYFDGVNFAKRASSPGWFSVGMMDDVCPPSTVYGAFHTYAGEKHITSWKYNGHEVGGVDGDLATLEILNAELRSRH